MNFFLAWSASIYYSLGRKNMFGTLNNDTIDKISFAQTYLLADEINIFES